MPTESEDDVQTVDNGPVELKVDPRAETNKLLKGIKTAVWALFGVVAAAAILHLR